MNPVPPRTPPPVTALTAPGGGEWPMASGQGVFASAEDYDSTGILAGVDPSESRYWWMPELYTSVAGGESAAAGAMHGAAVPPMPVPSAAVTDDRAAAADRTVPAGQAARRPGSRSPAAA